MKQFLHLILQWKLKVWRFIQSLNDKPHLHTQQQPCFVWSGLQVALSKLNSLTLCKIVVTWTRMLTKQQNNSLALLVLLHTIYCTAAHNSVYLQHCCTQFGTFTALQHTIRYIYCTAVHNSVHLQDCCTQFFTFIALLHTIQYIYRTAAHNSLHL